jgi:hypothetical protein
MPLPCLMILLRHQDKKVLEPVLALHLSSDGKLCYYYVSVDYWELTGNHWSLTKAMDEHGRPVGTTYTDKVQNF